MSTQLSSSKAKPVILCQGIHKTYGEGDTKIHALKGIDLTINRGELRLLMGPSGSGKTTLISILSGILTPDAGECSVEGFDLVRLSNGEKSLFRRKYIGFVFQAFNLVPMLSIEENVCIPLLLGDEQRERALSKAKEVLSELGLKDKLGKRPSELSGGQQQRVAIARAIIHKPHIIVCDEPTSFLDLQTGMKIMEILKELVLEGKITIVVVTHDPRIVKYADTIDHLEDGKIINR